MRKKPNPRTVRPEDEVESMPLAPRRSRSKPVLALVFLLLALMSGAAFYFYEPSQEGDPDTATSPQYQGDSHQPQNPMGIIGMKAAYHTFHFTGVFAWTLPIFFFLSAMLFLFRKKHVFTAGRAVAFLLFFFSTCGLAAFLNQYATGGTPLYKSGYGGWVGELIYSQPLQNLLGVFGSGTLFVTVWILSGLFLFIYRFPHVLGQAIEHYVESRKLAREARALRRKEQETTRISDLPNPEELPALVPTPKPAAKREWGKRKPLPEPDIYNTNPISLEEAALAHNAEAESVQLPPPPITQVEPKPVSRPTIRKASDSSPKIIQSEKVEKARQQLPKRKGDYIFPTLDLLENQQLDRSAGEEDYHATGEALTQTLETFGVKVTLKDIHVGPVITRYDVLPAPGTRVSNIQNLENDIAMGMKALAVRILAPVPGTNVVGIEVPNRVPQPVCLREILESKAWAESRAEIPIGLGKDVSGNPLVADLTKMPHLLIAGSTGSGKTVCINSIIASLLYHSSPEDLRFIMVDPKVVEMQIYNSLPHMLIPVVTDPKKVPHALKWLINEMTRRYNVFAKVKVRNIAGYNAYQKKNQGQKENLKPSKPNEQGEFEIPRELEDPEELPEKFPYIVCVIDELADLMMVAPADVEQGIARLAQLARAAGIHLILATQRPSVKVITGTIKANLPSRIAFKVAALVDSRTILDSKGAEQLIGRGDMLFLPPGQARLVRSQGAFVSDDEINDIVEFLKQNGEPQYEESVQNEIDRGGEGGGDEGGESDELYEDALDVLRNTKRASTSMLQRKLRIGYNRAARIMEILEDRGIVGPENGASPREILVDLDSL